MGGRTEFKRVKHGEQPGDLPRKAKIRLRELEPIQLFPRQILSRACAKAFRRYIAEKGKTVQRRRDKRACNEGMGDYLEGLAPCETSESNQTLYVRAYSAAQ